MVLSFLPEWYLYLSSKYTPASDNKPLSRGKLQVVLTSRIAEVPYSLLDISIAPFRSNLLFLAIVKESARDLLYFLLVAKKTCGGNPLNALWPYLANHIIISRPMPIDAPVIKMIFLSITLKIIRMQSYDVIWYV